MLSVRYFPEYIGYIRIYRLYICRFPCRCEARPILHKFCIHPCKMISYNFRNVPNCYITTQLIGKKASKTSRCQGKLLQFFISIYHREILKARTFHVKVNIQKTVHESTLQSPSRLNLS